MYKETRKTEQIKVEERNLMLSEIYALVTVVCNNIRKKIGRKSKIEQEEIIRVGKYSINKDKE